MYFSGRHRTLALIEKSYNQRVMKKDGLFLSLNTLVCRAGVAKVRPLNVLNGNVSILGYLIK